MKISQKLSSEFETELTELQHFIIGLCQIKVKLTVQVKLQLYFNYILNWKREKQVAMETMGYEFYCYAVYNHK
jgi:hypothetical protein